MYGVEGFWLQGVGGFQVSDKQLPQHQLIIQGSE